MHRNNAWNWHLAGYVALGLFLYCIPREAVSQDEMAERVGAVFADAELRCIDNDLWVDRIVALGDGPEAYLEPYLYGTKARIAIEALVRLASPEARNVLIACLKREWTSTREYSPTLADLVGAVRRAGIHAVEPELREMLAAVDEEEPANSQALILNLEAAAALIVVGSHPSETLARGFVASFMQTNPVYGEQGYWASFLVALAVMNTKESLDLLARFIVQDNYCIGAENFRSLPRDPQSEEFVRVLYKRVEETATYACMSPSDNFAAFEALSEMPLADRIVPPEFWQDTWDRCKTHMAGPTELVPGDAVTEDMLSERVKRVLKKRNIHL